MSLNQAQLFCLRWIQTERLGIRRFRQYVEAGLPLNSEQFEQDVLPLMTEIQASWQASAKKAEQVLKKCTKAKVQLMFYCDDDYPPMLKEISDPPIVLYVRGSRETLKGLFIAVVGTRKPTPVGERTTQKIIMDLQHEVLGICSGLALGIDGHAHHAALKSGLKTIAVLGTGVDIIYPSRHQPLADDILEADGAIISEMPLGTSARANHFPARNRIISGMSVATLVVEAALQSGSLITARQAIEQNREVFALPGSIHSSTSEGCHWLIQQGAKLITHADDILCEIGMFRDVLAPKKPLVDPSDPLLKLMDFELWRIESLAEKSNIPIEQLQYRLIQLEFEGIVKMHESTLWQRIK